ncbi:MAG: hypothetical protein EOM51_04095 [Clostridia bacterium]|nr:hypothetical protein [Clostridia bacterium]
MSEQWYDGAYFSRKFIFRFGDCDLNKNASLYSVLKLLSELAGEDYERRGLGFEYLRAKGRALLLSRVRLNFASMPVHLDRVIASTWERTIRGPYFLRDYEIKSESGELLVSGSSQWFLVDIMSREVLRPTLLAEGSRQTDLRKSACPDCEKLRKTDEMPLLGQRPVYFSDLDGNGHVNNAVYGKIAVDFLPEALRGREIRDFSINYFMETKPNETLEICGAETEKGYILQGISNDTLHFGCKFCL